MVRSSAIMAGFALAIKAPAVSLVVTRLSIVIYHLNATTKQESSSILQEIPKNRSYSFKKYPEKARMLEQSGGVLIAFTVSRCI